MEPIIGLWMYRNCHGDRVQQRLKDALEREGAQVIHHFDLRDCYCRDGRVFTVDGVDLSKLDLLYHMNADEQTPYQLNILRALGNSGVQLVNAFHAFERASDKFTTNQLLRRAGLPVPPALLVDAHTSAALIREVVGEWGSPAIVKARFSFGGKGVIRFERVDALLDYIEVTKAHQVDYYIERFVPFAERDFRVEVIDGACVGSYSRGLGHAYKTNVSACTAPSEARLLAMPPEPKFETLGQAAAAALGLSATIVDFVRSEQDGEPYILEVNCMLGIFLEAAVEALGIVRCDADLHEYASDTRKLHALASFLLRSAVAHRSRRA